MINENAIEIRNLSKKYKLGVIGTGMLSHDLNRWWSRFMSKKKHTVPNDRDSKIKYLDKYEEIWALKDINLKIKNGEVLGVIGKNGAGKSTLLKVLSRITTPTSGSAILRGRVGSLLEVGTGFHPELTGIENIYLNGAILGMKKEEIEKNIDQIIEFSGVKQYINTPIKRYSSGMNVRLAFSVAAYLNTDILIVDEVLSVGDYEFQKKCLRKIGDVSSLGKTVLIVSHNMSSIAQLCEKTILLDKGQIIKYGDTNDVIAAYLSKGAPVTPEVIFQNKNLGKQINKKIQLIFIKVINKKKEVSALFDVTEEIVIECRFKILDETYHYVPSMHLKNEKGTIIFHAIDTNRIWQKPREIGLYSSSMVIPGNLLATGKYYYTQLISSLNQTQSEKHIVEENIISFNVIDRMKGESATGNLNIDYTGAIIRPKLEWYQKQFDK
tara:strand:- start:3028 stop:4341 length:1314 start_codon:yes stop_codon:yes gene_type:complete